MIVVESSYMANNGKKSKKPAPVVAPRHARLVQSLIKAAKTAGWEEDQGYPANAEKAAAALKRAELRLLEALAEQYELVDQMGHALDVLRGDLEPCEGEDLEGCQSCLDQRADEGY